MVNTYIFHKPPSRSPRYCVLLAIKVYELEIMDFEDLDEFGEEYSDPTRGRASPQNWRSVICNGLVIHPETSLFVHKHCPCLDWPMPCV